MPSNPKRFETLGRHFVALTCRIIDPGAAEPGRYYAASGFIISVNETWFLITAGHIFEQMKQGQKGGARYINWQLDDGFAMPQKRAVDIDGPRPQDAISFPFSLDSEDYIWHVDMATGVDYAAIPIRPLFVKMLRANGVIPFEQKHWDLEGVGRASRIELIGIPSSTIIELEEGLFRRSLVSLTLQEPDSNAPDLAPYRDLNLLIGEHKDISEGAEIGFCHLEGMSGGPVVGFWTEADGTETYRILGIQSLWLKHINTVIAYPIIGLAMGLAKHFRVNSTEESNASVVSTAGPS